MSEITPLRLYIIHAPNDAAQVETLIENLTGDTIDIWQDAVTHRAGTAEWERSRHHAMQNVDAVLLIASPQVRRFPLVLEEIALAKIENLPIYPVWINGKVWRDSLPAGYEVVDYVDLRSQDETSIERLRAVIMGDTPLGNTDTATDGTAALLAPTAQRRNPYKGLHAFTADDKGDYYGRETLMQELLDDVSDALATLPLVCLVGASGSGKTSLIQAGLLPMLQADAIPGSANWIYVDAITPERQPLANLARALAPHHPQGLAFETILQTLKHPSTSGLHHLAQQIVTRPQQRLVLVIDSLEELFTLTTNTSEKQHVMDMLMTAIDIPDSPVLVITALRADAFDKPMQHAHFGQILGERQRTILPLSLTELEQVIQQPAKAPDVQVQFEEGLVGELAFALRDDADMLPLLQLTLTQLMTHRAADTLTWSAYHALGGITGVINTLAETAYNQLREESHRQAAYRLFASMIHLDEQGAYPQAIHKNDLDSVPMKTVAATFIETGLLTQEGDEDEMTIRITHPIVLRRWRRLANWIVEIQTGNQLADIFIADAETWQAHGQPDDQVYQGLQLERALDWAHRNDPPEALADFLSAALALRDAEETVNQATLSATQAEIEHSLQQMTLARNLALVVGVVSVLVLILAGAGWLSARSDRAAVAEIERIAPTIEALQVDVVAQATTMSVTQTAIVSFNADIVADVTQIAGDLAYQTARDTRQATLAAGGVVVPPVDTTPQAADYFATQTQSATLSQWDVVTMTDDFGIEMVLVPAGCFYMGSIAQLDEQPPHEICFAEPFWIDQFEMTNAAYRTVTGTEPPGQFTNDANPVDSLSWFAARNVCDARGARLPTEAEWEYAARGPNSLMYPWGNDFIAAHVVYRLGADAGARPVISATGTSMRPNGVSWVGAADMLGNLAEWTSTIYDELDVSQQPFVFQNRYPYPYRANDGREANESRQEFQARVDNEAIFTLRVVRGGAFNMTEGLRSANRTWDDPDDTDVTNGFRCVRG